MLPSPIATLRPGDAVHYAGAGYDCPMVVERISADRCCRGFLILIVSLRRPADAEAHLHMTIHRGNAAAFTRINRSRIAA